MGEDLKNFPKGYYYPELSAFGKTPPREEVLVKSFLKDDRFLLTSLDAYNALGVEQHSFIIVKPYTKRHGDFTLGNKTFSFRLKPHFPRKVTPEFLIVDLVNNLDQLAEDHNEVLHKVRNKVLTMNPQKVERALREYGNVKTKKNT